MLVRRADHAAKGRENAVAVLEASETAHSSTRLRRKEESTRIGARVETADAE
jgi:hypothetical protein